MNKLADSVEAFQQTNVAIQRLFFEPNSISRFVRFPNEVLLYF